MKKGVGIPGGTPEQDRIPESADRRAEKLGENGVDRRFDGFDVEGLHVASLGAVDEEEKDVGVDVEATADAAGLKFGFWKDREREVNSHL